MQEYSIKQSILSRCHKRYIDNSFIIWYIKGMKTNITMRSNEDRELYGVVIKQETQTGFMSLTDLQEAYTYARVANGWSDYRIPHVFEAVQNQERIYYVLNHQGIIKTGITEFMEDISSKGITKVLKECGAYKTTGRAENKRVMCNPYIWVLVAMELNPQLYAKVITWMTDKLILNRIEAGNFCKALNSALSKFDSPDFARVAKELNIAIFGKHELGIRNTASEKELERLYRLEDRIAFAINYGYVETIDEVVDVIRKESTGLDKIM